jgi:hypothetical protein
VKHEGQQARHGHDLANPEKERPLEQVGAADRDFAI